MEVQRATLWKGSPGNQAVVQREKSIPWQTENYQGHLRKFTVKDITPPPIGLDL